MKLTNEICISFLHGSGWLYNHDKEITISEHNKAIDDVLKLPKHTIYDTSNEFMNIRIDTISIEDILKLKEQNQ